jgi:MFS family permease
MKNNKKTKGLVIFVIAIALGLNITGLSPVLGILQEMNPTIETSKIQSLQTVTFGGLIVGSLAFGYLCGKLGEKIITIIGLVFIAICGLIPMFTTDFDVIFISRVLIGLGFGFIMPINLTIIARYFKEEERASYMGIHVVAMGVGSMIGNLFGGILAGIDYSLFYLVYATPLISAIIVGLILPKSEKAEVRKEDNSSKVSTTATILGVIYFIEMIFITSYSINIGMYISASYKNAANMTGLMTGINALFALLVGISFGKISKVLRHNTLIFSMLSSVLGFLALILLESTVGIVICSALCGVSLSSFMARSSILLSLSVEKSAIAKASGIFAVIGNLGGFFAPMILKVSTETLLGETNSYNQFIVSFVGAAILLICVVVLTRKGLVEKNPKRIKPNLSI